MIDSSGFPRPGHGFQEFGPMILASGGFGADFGSDSLLATYRPDLLHLPTTNGEHCTGQVVMVCHGSKWQVQLLELKGWKSRSIEEEQSMIFRG